MRLRLGLFRAVSGWCRYRRLSLLPVASCGLLFASLHAVAQTTPRIQEPWSNVFAGKEAVYHVQAPGQTAVPWRLSAMEATIQRGEANVSSGAAEIRLRIPEVKDGVVIPLTLTVGASTMRTLYAFPADPFTGRKQWLTSLDIQLFDPDGRTRTLFDDLEIPYTAWANVEALADQQDGFVVIGEGVSFDEYPALMEVMVGIAERLPVLCLAPASGEFIVPGTHESGFPEPEAVRLEKLPIIRTLDKRLDGSGWAPDGRVPLCGIRVESGRRGTMGVIDEDGSGWVWVDLRFPGERARLVICGIELIEAWPTSPTPRFLLLSMLEEMNPEEEKDP